MCLKVLYKTAGVKMVDISLSLRHGYVTVVNNVFFHMIFHLFLCLCVYKVKDPLDMVLVCTGEVMCPSAAEAEREKYTAV